MPISNLTITLSLPHTRTHTHSRYSWLSVCFCMVYTHIVHWDAEFQVCKWIHFTVEAPEEIIERGRERERERERERGRERRREGERGRERHGVDQESTRVHASH